MGSSGFGRLVAATCALLVVGTATAEAATVASIRYGPNPYLQGVFYTADPGEQNHAVGRLTDGISPVIEGGLVASVEDAGIPMTVASVQPAETRQRCTLRTGLATCFAYPDTVLLPLKVRLYQTVNLDLGDGDDVGELRQRATGYLAGGAGDDLLIGGQVSAQFPGGPGADEMIGTPGVDTVDYSQGYEDPYDGVPVHVSTDGIANDGRPGEGDNVHPNIEILQGTYRGDDVLVGNELDNQLWGFRGENHLVGAGGDDRVISAGTDLIETGDGNDNITAGGSTIRAGAGDDRIRASEGEIDCGPGFDTVFTSTPEVLTNCEDVTVL